MSSRNRLRILRISLVCRRSLSSYLGKVHIYHPMSSRTCLRISYKHHHHRIHGNEGRSHPPGSASRPLAMQADSARLRSVRPRAEGAYRPPSRPCPHAPAPPVPAPRRGRPAMRFASAFASWCLKRELQRGKGRVWWAGGRLDKHLCVGSCIGGMREGSVGVANLLKRNLELNWTKQDKTRGKSACVAMKGKTVFTALRAPCLACSLLTIFAALYNRPA